MKSKNIVKSQPIACLALFVSSLSFALGLAEVLLRIFPIPEQVPIKYRDVVGDPLHESHLSWGWRTLPNARVMVESAEYKISVRNNSRGIRGPEYSYTPETHEARILIIGDSFTAGYTVDFEETFGQIAEKKLNAQALHKYTVIAAGTEGWSTDQELLFFVEEGKKYQPDVTVLMFFFNDVWFNTQPDVANFWSKPFFRLQGQQLVLAEKSIALPAEAISRSEVRPLKQDASDLSIVFGIKSWLNKNSRLYHVVRRTVKNGFSLTTIPLRSAWFRYPLLDSVRVFKTSYDADIKAAWALTEALITQIKNEVARSGSRFVLFYVPPRESVYNDEWNRALKFHDLKKTEWRSDQVESELRRICAEHYLDCILPTQQFREQAEKITPKRLYLTNDPHWSPLGHELVGNILSEHVERLKIRRD